MPPLLKTPYSIHWNTEFIPVILVINQFRKNTTQFADAIISNFGKIPEHECKTILPNMPTTPTLFKLEKNPMMVQRSEDEKEYIVGVDMFIESAEQPEIIAHKCQRHAGVKFNLINVSNRGTQVWPTGSVYTNLVNQYNVRFESIDGSPLNQQDIIGLYVSLSGNFKIGSLRTTECDERQKGL